MATPPATPPKNYNVSEIKKFLFQPALTSNYEVHIPMPPAVKSFNAYVKLNESTVVELLKVSCSEATLPGSSLATHELNNDITGVTQRHAYRRLYDDRIDFTFYVTVDQKSEYDQIRFFERWMQFIAGEQESFDTIEHPFRVAWPEEYKTQIYITKFERNATTKKGSGKENSVNGSSGFAQKKITYTFFNAYPISVSSMPVSYDSSSLLKCTASFTYDKYIIKNTSAKSSGAFQEPGQSSATGVPNPFTQASSPEVQAAINAAYTQKIDLGKYSTGTFTNTNIDTSKLTSSSNTALAFGSNAPLF